MGSGLGLLLTFAVAQGAPDADAGTRTVLVTFDNGEFNAPMYAPRWNGKWRRPSLGQELATTVARVLGANPRVFTYMPPGRAEGRPGEVHEVAARRPDCEGPATHPTDTCWCSPADNCWSALQANYHPSGSTSLVRTVGAVRAAVQNGGGRPRLEVHFTDFFEEDPAAADDPADSDRCVTADGVRRAMAGVLSLGEGESLDHLAVGVLQSTIDPPPPGGGYGWTYQFVPAADAPGCWSGALGRPWGPRSEPLSLAMGVVVVGVGTASSDAEVTQLIDGLEAQLSGAGSGIELVTLVGPTPVRRIDTVLTSADADPYRVSAAEHATVQPCGRVTATAELATAEGRLQLADVQGRCDGQAGVSFGGRQLERHFIRSAGMNPGIDTLDIHGHIQLQTEPDAVGRALARVDASGAERDLPLWSAAAAALDPVITPGSPVQPWSSRVEITSLRVTDIDRRPWLFAVMAATALALVGGLATSSGLKQLHAARAMRSHYEASTLDPLKQRPLSLVIAEAQKEVARGWIGRNLVAVGVALVLLAVTFVSVMMLYRVLYG